MTFGVVGIIQDEKFQKAKSMAEGITKMYKEVSVEVEELVEADFQEYVTKCTQVGPVADGCHRIVLMLSSI